MIVLERKVGELEQQMTQLNQAVADLQQKSCHAAREAERGLQQMLLGQAALVLAQIIERHVYGPCGAPHELGVPPLLKKMAERTGQMVLTEDQLIRWTAARGHVSQSMPIEELFAADCFLRKSFRAELAHGPELRLQSRTLQDFKKWAGLHCGPKAVVPVRKYVELLSQFPTNNQPLAPNRSLAENLHMATTSIG